MKLKRKVVFSVFICMSGVVVGSIRCKCFDQAKFLDIAGNGCLGNTESFLIQSVLEFFLCIDIRFRNQFQNFA